MQAWITNKARKDGKHKVIIGFDNGKRFTKIMTPEKITKMVNDKKDNDIINWR